MGHAVKTLERESASKLRENDGNAQFSFCLIADTTKCRIASEARSGISFSVNKSPSHREDLQLKAVCVGRPSFFVAAAMTAEIFALGSALVSGAGEAVPGSRTFSRVVSARRRKSEPDWHTRETRALPNPWRQGDSNP